ncbi:alanine racemase [Lutimaribacter sp. EGI FJ00015]|uniref:Alanine racemase n=1 Tax=Lutimaribacter degradans TaxID=2945989 RepID=A0ACC5ZU94_9RHOB|nr:alanine racemase [Lutimaribacter sp. EGI FJ00013]MCM2560954.1 alanine racemase [Lutimaribacter sp. EGI FJ00013]MCO0612100.1 alanine racemase [Lutimaribacter sp. EGI FJ00015]MCO0634780.1 alanine racemase [Lutimaribacter sp. EGI FJ00014]
MTAATLTIDLDAIAANWRALDAKTACETAAVVKADGYGCGVGRVARRLAHEGARRFFVAVAEEGAALRQELGPGPEINVFSGHMPGDTDMIGDLALTPMINSLDQMLRHLEALPGAPFGIQLDSGMNRLGMEPAEWGALRDLAVQQNLTMVMSHLACADEPDHAMNAQQVRTFRQMTDGLSVPRSLAATGGILLGPDYHFELTRPGVGLYGGRPFAEAQPVAHVQVPVIQIRDVEPDETVGYGNTWVARAPARIATIAAGYADGIIRGMGAQAYVWVGDTPCKVVGRISMDLIGVDVTGVTPDPEAVELLGHHNGVDTLADAAGTIGYEILTSLGARYRRRYHST